MKTKHIPLTFAIAIISVVIVMTANTYATNEHNCVYVTRNSSGEAVIKNICSYQISVWTCDKNGGGVFTYESGDKITQYNVIGNISYAACKGATGISPYVANTNTHLSDTCNTYTRQFGSYYYTCK